MPPRASQTYVIGHRNPDTDAICSAIAYADFLSRTRIPDAVPARCGSLTARTEWVLRQAGVPPPELVMDMRLRLSSICRTAVATASPDETFYEVYARMIAGGLRAIPIVDPQSRMLGMLSLLDLLALLLPAAQEDDGMRIVRTTLRNMRASLDGRFLFEPGRLVDEDDIVVMVAASSTRVIASRLEQFEVERVVVITGDRPEVHELAIESGVRCLVVTGGLSVSDELVQRASEKSVGILSTRRDTASTTQLIRGSRRVESAISSDYLQFPPDALVEDVRARVLGSAQPVFPVIDPETGKLAGCFSKSDLVDPAQQRLVLVDHNEFAQAVAGADEADIIEVIDHHRLSGNLVSREPLQFINRPVGSTCTIVAGNYRIAGLQPSKSIATCLCAGIVSDTLNLTSPTATQEDRDILAWLREVSGLDIDRFTEEFFATGSVLRSLSPADALLSDRKEYTESGFNVSISQIEEVGLNHFWPAQDALQEELRRLLDGAIDVACLMVTDVGRHVSILLIEGPEDVVERVDYPKRDHGVYELDGVVSRKKQLFPWISRLLVGVTKS
jgi:manganese-dependent inorganic pyrophosphatase